MEVHDPSLQMAPTHGMEDSGGNAAKRGVADMHGVTGARLDLLHPGHDPVQQVGPVAQAQGVSSIALDRQAQARLWLRATVVGRVQRVRKQHVTASTAHQRWSKVVRPDTVTSLHIRAFVNWTVYFGILFKLNVHP